LNLQKKLPEKINRSKEETTYKIEVDIFDNQFKRLTIRQRKAQIDTEYILFTITNIDTDLYSLTWDIPKIFHTV